MKIVGLVGRSGTGKSTVALELAKQKNIDYILDDGLLINVDEKSVVEGISAKGFDFFNDFEKVMKTALFMEIYHAKKVMDAITNCRPKALLVLGTSNQMIEIIQANLQLPEVEKIIKIEDISSEKEISAALKARRAGKHSLPVAMGEVRKALGDFRGCVDDVDVNLKKFDGSQKGHVEITKSFAF